MTQHSFDIDIAKEYGVLEAVLLMHLQFWIEKNRANETNFFDGEYWTYNSTRAFNELFPYVSERQIKTALKHLRDEGIIKVGNYNTVAYDRTLWYAFTKKGQSIVQKCPMDSTKMSNGKAENVRPIPNINTDIKPNINTDINTHKKPKRKQSVFVPPTLEEIEAYCKKRNNAVDAKHFYDYYEAGNWIDAKGNEVRNWKQKIITWEKSSKIDTKQGNQPSKQPSKQEEELLKMFGG